MRDGGIEYGSKYLDHLGSKHCVRNICYFLSNLVASRDSDVK
jgi:hypothetical protein